MTHPAPALTIRPLENDDDRRAAFALFRQAMIGIADFGRDAPDLEANYLRAGDPIGAFEGEVLLGTANAYEGGIVLPGGAIVRHAGVTHVGVATQATRRGIARQLLAAQLRRAKAAGFAIAGLRASDSRIYGRYGYGIGSWAVRHTIDLTRARLAVPAPALPTRAVNTRDSFPLFKRIAASDPSPRPASLVRWDSWWTMQASRLTSSTTPHHAIVVGSEGQERGYIRFHAEPTDNWLTTPQRSVIIDDLVAHDAEAWQALIGHLLAQDVLHRAVFPSRPVDDPLPLLLDDPRVLEVSGLRDESWLRVLDLETLLAGRSYGEAAPVILAIYDPILPENSGHWRIETGNAKRSTEPADATLTLPDLTALLFGAQSATALADSGRLNGASDAVIDRLDRLFFVRWKPYAGVTF